MELHSEIESYRRVLTFRTPDGGPASVIIMRRRDHVWITFDGAMKTTLVVQDEDTGQLIEAIHGASGGPR